MRTLNAWLELASNLAQFAIPAALFAWADRPWKPADRAAASPPADPRR